MADLTTEYFWHCSTSESWATTINGSKGATYNVQWNNWAHKNRFDFQYDYSCDCRGYKYGKGKHCKHIEEAKTSGEHCNWLQFNDGKEAVKKGNDHHCPCCDEKVHSMGWGV